MQPQYKSIFTLNRSWSYKRIIETWIFLNTAPECTCLNVIKEFLEFYPEDPIHQYWSIVARLVWSETVLDFWPVCIACECYEEVGLLVFSHYGHCVLKPLMVLSFWVLIWWWEEHGCGRVPEIGVRVDRIYRICIHTYYMYVYKC